MAKNTTHKFWYLFSYTCGNMHDSFYIAVPIKDMDANCLIIRISKAFRCGLIDASIIPFTAQCAYADMRDGTPFHPFSFAVALWHGILDGYYTKDALDNIFQGY